MFRKKSFWWLFCVLCIMLVFVLSLERASADISFTNEIESDYLLGDSLVMDVEIVHNVGGNYLFSAVLGCESLKMKYYVGLVSLEKDKKINLKIPSVPLGKEMEGDCGVSIFLETLSGSEIYRAESKLFNVDNEIKVDIKTNKEEYMPGENIIISGKFLRTGKYNLSIDFSKSEEEINERIDGELFSYVIKTEEDIEAGLGRINIAVEDDFGNSFEGGVDMNIVQVAKRLEIKVVGDKALPGKDVEIGLYLYDQSEKSMRRNVEVKIFDPANIVIGSESKYSGGGFSVKLDERAMPGKYLVEAKSERINASSFFEVERYESISVSVDGGFVNVRNIGNVELAGEGLIEAGDGTIVYQTPVFLSLVPGEGKEIDLGAELPEGNYSILFKTKNFSYEFGGILISDKRGIGKKMAQVISRISGRSVIDTTKEKNVFGIILLVIMLGGVAIYLSRGKLRAGIEKFEGSSEKKETEDTNKFYSAEQEKKTVEEAKKLNVGELIKEHFKKEGISRLAKNGIGMKKRDVSVMALDLGGFGRLSESLGDEEADKIINSRLKEIDENIKKRGGVVSNVNGNSIVAVFNALSEHKDHTARALRAGVEIKKNIDSLNKYLEKENIEKIKVGIGIDSGMAGVGNIEDGKEMELNVFGVPVNVAVKLKENNERDGVLVSDRVYARTKQEIQADNVGSLRIDNVNKAVGVFNVVGFEKN